MAYTKEEVLAFTPEQKALEKRHLDKMNDKLKPCPFCGGTVVMKAMYKTPKTGQHAYKEMLCFSILCSDHKHCVLHRKWLPKNYYSATELKNEWNCRKEIE